MPAASKHAHLYISLHNYNNEQRKKTLFTYTTNIGYALHLPVNGRKFERTNLKLIWFWKIEDLAIKNKTKTDIKLDAKCVGKGWQWF